MICEPAFLDHWKFKLLITRTSDESAPLMILRLWLHCQRMRKTRFLLTAEALAVICHYTGKPADFLSLLLELRFLDEDGDHLVVHNFDRWNGKLVSCWDNGSKGGRTKKRKTQSRLGFCERNPNAVSQKPIPSSLSNLSLLKEGVRGRFDEWMKYRRGLGGNVKDWTTLFRKQIEWLPQFSEQDQLLILDQSMRNGWRGLFEPKTNNEQVKKPDPRQARTDREFEEAKQKYG